MIDYFRRGGCNTMARLPLASRATIPAGQEAAFDEATQNGANIPAYGPGSVMAYVPEAWQRATALNQYLRNEGSLPHRAAELAMLVVAQEMDCQHIWKAHEASARAAGVPDDVVNALAPHHRVLIRDRASGREYPAYRAQMPELTALESTVINLGRQILAFRHQVSRAIYESAVEVFGQQGAIELTLVLGNYTMLAMLINTFETDLPPEREEPLLPV